MYNLVCFSISQLYIFIWQPLRGQTTCSIRKLNCPLINLRVTVKALQNLWQLQSGPDKFIVQLHFFFGGGRVSEAVGRGWEGERGCFSPGEQKTFCQAHKCQTTVWWYAITAQPPSKSKIRTDKGSTIVSKAYRNNSKYWDTQTSCRSCP